MAVAAPIRQSVPVFGEGIGPTGGATQRSQFAAEVRGRYQNAVIVELIPSGSNPSATFQVIDSSIEGSGYIASVDPNGLQSNITGATKILVANVLKYVRVDAKVSTGIWQVRVTPVRAANQSRVTPVGGILTNAIDGSAGPIVDTNPHAVIPAQNGKRIWVTQITVSNTSATPTMVEITGLDSGNTYWIPCPASTQGAAVTLPTPLKGAVGTALSATAQTNATNCYVSASGYVA